MISLITACVIGFLAACATSTLGSGHSQARLGVDTVQPANLPGGDEGEKSPIRLNFSSPAPHIFHSTFSLLKQVPNTVFPNGHTLASVVIPPLTLFYHARRDAEAPASPEWVAFDSDMSYGIMGGHRNVWMWTYQTARPVKALYFDGESGNLEGLGQFDFQMLLLYGNVTGPSGIDDIGLEYERARGLCDWLAAAGLRGSGWGYEGVVRMNAGFEMIWCDFLSDSLRLISRINVTAPLLPKEDRDSDGDEERQPAPPSLAGGEVSGELLVRRTCATRSSSLDVATTSITTRPVSTPNLPDMPPGWKDRLRREPFQRTRSWGWFDSATWHYGASGVGASVGETRAKLSGCGVFTFYSRKFTNQSLNRALEERQRLNLTGDGLWTGGGDDTNRTEALTQLRRRRRFHHMEHASQEEAHLMKKDIEMSLETLLQDDSRCSGTDWALIMSDIVRRTTSVLRDLELSLVSTPQDWSDKHSVRRWLHNVRGRSHMFLVNVLQYPETEDLSVWSTHSALFNKTYGLCRSRYTALLEEDTVLPVTEEAEQKWAIEETFGTICLVQLHVGFGMERRWRETFGGSSTKRSESLPALRDQARVWSEQLSELTAWLGWEDSNIGCKDVCAANERCYIPMWPITRPSDSASSPRSVKASRRPWIHTDERDLWEPKCVSEVCIEGLCDL
ncbi:uncharacterized protein E0L32_006609 [Thyridium curvatum]|uniref:Uncharacterized protein n=1 Tax=Thyridium curvatum TaxID=1093900 RepID=A0A507B2L5_9PEZI|nr:uncharacterized protein E0L32_006609 [Thyridium curvatum]TPX12964.1 hypothetical protein E0L32_006609 [Thyridium curvatum]